MNWYYVEAGAQRGPVTDAELAELVRTGHVTGHTLVWRDGMSNWRPYHEQIILSPPPTGHPLRPEPAAVAPPPGSVACCECGNFFSPDELVRYGDQSVCALCKPRFVQRFAGGAPAGEPAGEPMDEAALLAREYRVDIGGCFERAWKLFTAQPGTVVGATALVIVVFVGCWLLSEGIGRVVPFAGAVLPMFFTGPLMGGLMWFFLLLARGESAGVGDAFAGFGQRFGQLVLASVVQGSATALCTLPLGLMLEKVGFTAELLRQHKLPQLTPESALMLVGLGLFTTAVVTCLNTLWTFSLTLVLDKRMSFWPAMELSRKLVSKRFWMTLLFVFVANVLFSMGLLACCVGLFVTIPLHFAMRVHLYDDNFRDLKPPPD